MHAPAQETSNSLILDLVSRFLSKILTNDPNITHYMKQWSSFQDILTTVPFSLSTAFSHITTVTPLEHAKPTLIRPSPITEINSIMRNLSTDLNGSFDALPSVPKPEDKVQRRRGNSYGGPQDAPWSREDASRVKPSRFAQHISSASTNDSATRKMFNILSDDIVSGNSVDYSDSGSGYFSKDLGLTSTVSKHYLSSLAARAKKLKDNIENNTDTLVTLQNINANAVKYNVEERSPLRKLKVYERQADNNTGAYNFGLNLNPVSDYGSNQNNNYMQRLKLY